MDRKDRIQELAPNWAGDRVGYKGLHKWVQTSFGKPSLCEHCGTTTAKIFDWANVSRLYKRDRSDWIRLCRSCHSAYDSNGFKAVRLYEYAGREITLKQLAQETKIKYFTLYSRIHKYGMTVDQAVSYGVRQ